MDNLFRNTVAALGCLMALASCRDSINDAAGEMMKNHMTYYLHNETDQDVTVLFRPQEQHTGECAYLVRKGAKTEIPESVFLGSLSLRYLECDSVVMISADGRRTTHTYTNRAYDQDGVYDFVYDPAVNNIFMTGYDLATEDESWVKTRTGGWQQYRKDYYIRTEK